MIRTITKIGDSQGLMFDEELMDLAHIQVGDQVSISISEDGVILLTPLRPVITPDAAGSEAKRLIGENFELFRRL